MEDRNSLELAITLEELQLTSKVMPNNKAPGLDGLPTEIYKQYGNVLFSQLLATLHAAYEDAISPASVREVIIVIIPKAGKDLLKPDFYCPISLLTTDVKILVKVLAKRFSKVVGETDTVHPDQSGFIPTRSTALHIR